MNLVKIFPELNAKIDEARRLIAKGRYDEAESLYVGLLRLAKDKKNLLEELLQLYWKSRQIDKAVDCLEQLIKIFPEEPHYYLDLASLCENAGYLDKAIESYRGLLKIKPNLPNSWYNIARLLKRSGSYQEALNSYKQAIQYGASKEEEIYNNIAVIYSELHQEKKAISNLELALKINSGYIPALFNLGGIFEEAGREEEAIQQYMKILSLDEHYYPALCRIANMVDVSDCGNSIVLKVEKALNRADLDLESKEELFFAYGKLLDSCGNFDKAFESYHKANELGRKRFSRYDKKVQERRVDGLMRIFKKARFSTEGAPVNVNPIFICGMYRSGSTLVEQILSGHSRVTAGGELNFFSKLAKKVYSGGGFSAENFDLSSFETMVDSYYKFLSERFNEFDIITDKCPDNFLHIGLIKAVFPKSKIVWTRRNLLDNCLSIYFQHLGGDMSYSVDLDAIGHYYSQQVRLMGYWKSLFPDSIFELHYENLVESPETEIRSLLHFLELGWEESCLEFRSRKNYVKTASIWQVRKSIYKKSSGRHKKYAGHIGVLNKYLSCVDSINGNQLSS